MYAVAHSYIRVQGVLCCLLYCLSFIPAAYYVRLYCFVSYPRERRICRVRDNKKKEVRRARCVGGGAYGQSRGKAKAAGAAWLTSTIEQLPYMSAGTALKKDHALVVHTRSSIPFEDRVRSRYGYEPCKSIINITVRNTWYLRGARVIRTQDGLKNPYISSFLRTNLVLITTYPLCHVLLVIGGHCNQDPTTHPKTHIPLVLLTMLGPDFYVPR